MDVARSSPLNPGSVVLLMGRAAPNAMLVGMIPTLLAFALACNSPADPDDTGPMDTGTPEGWPEAIPECADLAAPFPLATGDDVDGAWAARPQIEVLSAAMGLAQDAGEATGCPAVIDDSCGAGLVITGGCDEGGVQASGSARNDGCDDGGTWYWQGFSITSADPAWSFDAEGTVSAYVSGDMYVDFDVTSTLHGVCAHGACEGTFTWSGTDDISYQESRHQRVTAAPAGDARSGDYCIDEELTTVDGCDEPTGWTVIQGDHTAVVLWDGDLACDACGELYVDGEHAGSWCR